MDMTRLMRLLPTAQMIAQELSLLGWDCVSCLSDPQQAYSNVRPFTGQKTLQCDILYVLRPGETRFPTDTYSFVSTDPIAGGANHIFCPGQPPEAVLDALLDLFSRCRQMDDRIDQLVYRNGSLNELCELGEELLDNPVFIHDDWFIIIGISQPEQFFFDPEFVNHSRRAYVPKVYTENFKHDSDYTKSYTYMNAQLWREPDGTPGTLYVNLWDGDVFRGRLLALRKNRDFRQLDYLICEVLTQRAILMLRKRGSNREGSRSMDDRVFALLEGKQTDESELSQLLSALNWRSSQPYLCIRLRPQDPAPNILLEHMLHSDLFQAFPNSYILFEGREQCVVMNLAQTPIPPAQLHHLLAPLCRDYCLYAGISSPVSSIRELHLAYYQARIALNQAFSLQSEKWIIDFNDCKLEHLLDSMDSPLAPRHLVAPDLYILMQHDREKDTQYLITLRTWILLERDIPKTSEALIIHRTTLLYRLKKIQALISSNLDDPWQRLNLMLSFWILDQDSRQAP